MANAKIAKVITEEGSPLVTWKWADGTVTEVDVRDLPEEMLIAAAVHGVKQKGSDCYAGAKENGWSVADCRELTEEVLANVRDGNWNRKATGTGGIVVEAMANLSGKTREEVNAFIDSQAVRDLTREDILKSFAKEPQVKAEVARLRAERAAQAAKGKTFKLDI